MKHSFTKLFKDLGDNVSTFLSTGALNDSNNPQNGSQVSQNSSLSPIIQQQLNSNDHGIEDKSQILYCSNEPVTATRNNVPVSTSEEGLLKSTVTISRSVNKGCGVGGVAESICLIEPPKFSNSSHLSQNLKLEHIRQIDCASQITQAEISSHYSGSGVIQFSENKTTPSLYSSSPSEKSSSRSTVTDNCQIVWSSCTPVTSVLHYPTSNVNFCNSETTFCPAQYCDSNGDYSKSRLSQIPVRNVLTEVKSAQPIISPKNANTHFGIDLPPIKCPKNSFHKFHTRLWCIFCQKSDHNSHFCQRFRSKEEYWEKVLCERRCKNCLRLFHKSDSCYSHSYCRNFGCRRKDKHSPVLCSSNYFYSNSFPSTFHPFNAHLQQRRKPPPLMSINLGYTQYEMCTPPLKTTLDVSTQTCLSHFVPNKFVSFKSQYSQTDFISTPSVNIKSICAENDLIVNPTTKHTKSKQGQTLDSILASSNLNQLFDNEKSVQSKEKVKKENVKLSNFESISFSEMINYKDPIVDNTKVKYWQNTKNPDYFRALQYLRHQAAKEDKSDIDIDVINCAIRCIQKFMDRSSPNTACLYRVQLNEVIQKLPVSKI